MATQSPKGLRPPTKDETAPATEAGSKPVARFTYGSVSAAVFQQETTTDNGKRRTLSSVSLRKSYRDAARAWKHSHTLWPDDLPLAITALQQCYEPLTERRSSP